MAVLFYCDNDKYTSNIDAVIFLQCPVGLGFVCLQVL